MGGEVAVQGRLGPLNLRDRGSIPASGRSMQQAEMTILPRVAAGTLGTVGEFHGRLSALDVQGSCTVPDFLLTWDTRCPSARIFPSPSTGPVGIRRLLGGRYL